MIRGDFEGDRRYRLLAAVAAKSEVEPMPPWRASLFSEEQQLGSLPMDQAFQKLAQIEPRLLDIERRAKLPDVRLEENHGLPKSINRDLHPLVGGGAERDNELLRSNLATSLVHQHLQALLDPSAIRVDVSYWAAPRKVMIVSGTFRRPRESGKS
jgi:hypothetical protein